MVGWPDFTFAVFHKKHVVAVAWEVKLPGGKLRPEQENMKALLTTPPNAWVYAVITSVDEALAELKKYS